MYNVYAIGIHLQLHFGYFEAKGMKPGLQSFSLMAHFLSLLSLLDLHVFVMISEVALLPVGLTRDSSSS